MNFKNLKMMRESSGLTQVEIAREIGVTANTYRNWEYGANQPNEGNLARLKVALYKDRAENDADK